MGKNEKGFGAMEALIVVLAVVLVGALGFIFWQNFINKEMASDSTTTSTEKEKKDTVDQKSDPSENGKYLVLNDWGVRFEIPDELKNTEVTWRKKVNDQGAEYYRLNTKRVEALSETCNIDHDRGWLAFVRRVAERPGEDQVLSSLLLNNEPIGGYYYIATGMQEACNMVEPGSEYPPNGQAVSADSEAMIALLRTISAVK